MRRTYRIGAALGLAALLAALGPQGRAAAQAVQGIVIKHDNSRYEGMILYQQASRRYVVDVRGVIFNVALSDVKELQIEQPPDMARAAQMVEQQRQYAAAIPVLERIVKSHHMLQWDLIAARYLGECYIETKRAKEARAMFQKVLDSNPRAAESPEFAPLYWKVLYENDEISTLKRVLSQAIASGPRPLAARAQNMRGDIERKANHLTEALLDGYLRTVVLFRDVKGPARAEALYGAAVTFKDLGRHTDADRMRRTLMTEFPDSPYVERLRAAM